MSKKELINKKIKKAKIEIGDKIKIDSKTIIKEGIFMPHHQFSDDDVVTIKLDNGYNIGIAVDKDTKITLLEKHKQSVKKTKEISFDKHKLTISIVGTGGTIACYVDYRTGAVYPASSTKDLAFAIPEILDICNVKTQVAFQILSENFEVKHWQKLAHIVAEELNNGIKGVIIPHGTDTLGYTAAALSFMLKNLTGPVVLVGAQRSSDRPSSDAELNLLSAAIIASKSDIGEVVAVMHNEISDTCSAIHRGTKLRKFHTSRRDAFKTVNEEILGFVENGEIKINTDYNKISKDTVVVDDKMLNDVSIIYVYPGLKPSDIPDKKGVVFVGTGLGHVPNKIISRIKKLTNKGNIFVMTSQCIFGRVNMSVYSTGRDLLKAGVISCKDMLPETAYVKLMWALGHSKKHNEVEKIMNKNISGEISIHSRSNTFL